MIIKRSTMLGFGFQVMGLDFGSNSSVYMYRKYYTKQLMMLVADGYESSLYAFQFRSKEEMAEFMDGKFAITADPSKDGKPTLGGVVYRFLQSISMNEALNIFKIKTIKHLKDGIALFEKKYINNNKKRNA